MKVGDLERAEKWFATMRKHGISANAICFSVLLNACAKASDPDRAEHWLQVKDTGMTLQGCFFDFPQLVLDVHQVMHEEGVTPNVVCYNNVIDACAKAGKAERAVLSASLLACVSRDRAHSIRAVHCHRRAMNIGTCESSSMNKENWGTSKTGHIKS